MHKYWTLVYIWHIILIIKIALLINNIIKYTFQISEYDILINYNNPKIILHAIKSLRVYMIYYDYVTQNNPRQRDSLHFFEN